MLNDILKNTFRSFLERRSNVVQHMALFVIEQVIIDDVSVASWTVCRRVGEAEVLTILESQVNI